MPAARRVRPLRPGRVPEDVGLQGHAALRAAQHAGQTYEQTKTFAQGHRRRCSSAATPSSSCPRCAATSAPGKVFIDWSQNDEHKTTVCVYSLRARERPTVSTPVTWDEVEDVLRSRRPGRAARSPPTRCSTAWPSTGTASPPCSTSSRSCPADLGPRAAPARARRRRSRPRRSPRACSSSSGVPDVGISRTASLRTGGRSSASASASSTASPRPPSGQWSSTVTIAPHSRAAARERRRVDRLDRVAVDHARLDAVAGERLRRRDRLVDGDAAGHDRHVVALAHDARAADPARPRRAACAPRSCRAACG